MDRVTRASIGWAATLGEPSQRQSVEVGRGRYFAALAIGSFERVVHWVIIAVVRLDRWVTHPWCALQADQTPVGACGGEVCRGYTGRRWGPPFHVLPESGF